MFYYTTYRVLFRSIVSRSLQHIRGLPPPYAIMSTRGNLNPIHCYVSLLLYLAASPGFSSRFLLCNSLRQYGLAESISAERIALDFFCSSVRYTLYLRRVELQVDRCCNALSCTVLEKRVYCTSTCIRRQESEHKIKETLLHK